MGCRIITSAYNALIMVVSKLLKSAPLFRFKHGNHICVFLP